MLMPKKWGEVDQIGSKIRSLEQTGSDTRGTILNETLSYTNEPNNLGWKPFLIRTLGSAIKHLGTIFGF